MNDLTQGSVTKHLLQMAAFMGMSMLVQTLYLLADMYWVGRLGKEAIAAVGVAGNLMMVVLAVTQMLGVGTTTAIAHAAGRKDKAGAELALNQSTSLSIVVGLGLGIIAFFLRDLYSNSLSADAATAALARSYLNWFIPALLLQFPLISLGAALRGSGIIKPVVGIQVLSVALNMVVAPLLIFGPGFLPKMGVAGAAAATFLAILIADVLLLVYFEKKFHFVRLRRDQMRPRLASWTAMLKIGLPAGAEFALMSVYIFLVYGIIRGFGAAAQAGFGVGARVMQAMFLPVVALSFAVSPIVGQNIGARRADRVRQSIWTALLISSALMLLLTVIAQVAPAHLIGFFSKDPAVMVFGGDYLRIISFNFIAAGIAFTTSSVFQGIGNTMPPLLSSMSRLVLFALPAVWLSTRPAFAIRHVWYLSVVSIFAQAVFNLFLLRRELRRRLSFQAPAQAPLSGAGAAEVT